jgi:colicin import membrane protein
MGSGLLTEIKNNPWALALVIVFHIVLIVLLSINLASDEKPPMPAAQKHKIIDAVVIDATKYDEREKQKKLAAQKKIDDKKAAEKKRKQELEKKKQLEKQRLAEKKKQQEKLAAEKKKAAEKQRAAEKKKALALAKKKEAEKKEKERLAREKKEKERLAKEKAAKEKKERELKEKQRLEAERKRKEEEERQRRAEEKAEMERAMLEEEQARIQAARAARLQTLLQQYIMQIDRAVESNWLRPATTSEEQSCDVIVTQTMSGDVIDVQLQSCTSDNAFQRSVERAVRKASPLPLPPDPELFDRKIQFTFKH